MKITKGVGLALCAVLSLATLAGCGSSSGSADAGTKTLKIAFNQPESHPEYQALEAFGKKLKERTNGAYDVKIFPNETLGAQQETITGVESGAIDASVVVGSLMENLNPDFVAFDLPYVFDSMEQQMSVLRDPAVTGDLYSSLEGQGIHVAGAFHAGIRNVYTKDKAIKVPADLNGQKIRVIQNDTMVDMMNLMGGVGTAMGQGDVYTAIQSGVLNGGENNELIYNGLKHDEVAKHYSYTKHLMIPDYFIVNSKVYKGMSDAHKKAFDEEFSAAIDTETTAWSAAVEKAKAASQASGATFTDVDTKPFREAVQPLIDKKLKGSDEARKLYDAVQNAK